MCVQCIVCSDSYKWRSTALYRHREREQSTQNVHRIKFVYKLVFSTCSFAQFNVMCSVAELNEGRIVHALCVCLYGIYEVIHADEHNAGVGKRDGRAVRMLIASGIGNTDSTCCILYNCIRERTKLLSI